MRVKIDNKKVFRYERTVSGLKELLQEIDKENIPNSASVDWRQWNVAELVWSVEENGLHAPQRRD